MVSCLSALRLVFRSPARARVRARAFGYGLTMLTMLACADVSICKSVTNEHGQAHGACMVIDHGGKESFNQAHHAVETTPVYFARVTLRNSRLTDADLVMTASDLAKEWGCSRQAIAKWVAKGMPLISMEEASAWRAANSQRAPRCNVAQAAAAYPDPDGPVSLDTPVPGETCEVAEVRERSNRSKVAEREAMKLLDTAKEAKDVHAIRLALDKVIATQERARDAAEELGKARAAAGIMMTRSQHNQTVERLAAEFQRGMEALVNKSSKLAGKSADEIHAVLREETGRCYESIKARMIA